MALTQIDDRGLKTPIDLLDNEKIRLGTGNDLEIYSGGTGAKIHCNTGVLELEGDSVQIWNHAASEAMAKFTADAGVELYYDNSKKLETDTNGVTITGQCAVTSHVAFPDHSSGYVGKAVFGGGDDLQIYHDGSNSVLNNGTGDLYIKSADDIFLRVAGDESGINIIGDAGVDLYHNNSKVFETLGNGVRVQGGVLFGSDTADANRINDYEEGSWTPDPFHHQSVITQIGRYTKIGNMVYAYFNIAWSSSSSSHQYISNLPFVSSNSSGGTGGVARGYQNKDIQDGPIYSIGTNTNDMYFYKDNGVAFSAADGTGNNFAGYVVYQTDA